MIEVLIGQNVSKLRHYTEAYQTGQKCKADVCLLVQTSAGPSEDYTLDEGQSGQEDKAGSKPLHSKRFMYETCMDCLQHRDGNLVAVATVAQHGDDSAAAAVNSADETSCSNSQESNSAEDDDVSLESVD